MPGDRELGAVLRDLRRSRGMTLAAVARQAGCAESLVCYVESGRRRLHPWLAAQLDGIYRTGGVVASLSRRIERRYEASSDGVSADDTLMVELPGGGVSMPLSRRELLAALGVGIPGGALLSQFERALDAVPISDDMLRFFEDAHEGFQAAVRAMPPAALTDGLIGNVAILDGLRRRSDGRIRQALSRMQARYAESLSWLSEEAGNLSAAMYWIDRACQWGQAADWSAMSAYGFVRRSMMVISFSNDGSRAVDQASAVLAIRNTSPRMQGLATKQIAFGHALAGDGEASSRALDGAMRLMSRPVREDDAVLGQRSVVNDDLFAIFQATCDVYLGRGDRAIPVLAPRLSALSAASARTATITRAKLVHAYASIGQPAEAAQLSLRALNDIDRVGSRSAHSELRRALPALQQWHGREDVQLVIRRLSPNA